MLNITDGCGSCNISPYEADKEYIHVSWTTFILSNKYDHVSWVTFISNYIRDMCYMCHYSQSCTSQTWRIFNLFLNYFERTQMVTFTHTCCLESFKEEFLPQWPLTFSKVLTTINSLKCSNGQERVSCNACAIWCVTLPKHQAKVNFRNLGLNGRNSMSLKEIWVPLIRRMHKKKKLYLKTCTQPPIHRKAKPIS